jgi:hypothetical protein
MKLDQIDSVISNIEDHSAPSKWQLDNVFYHDRTTSRTTLYRFLSRIKKLKNAEDNNANSACDTQELKNLLELLDELDSDEIADILTLSEEDARESFIEELARISAIEVLTNGKLSFNTMNTACNLTPNDFILCAKRTQDLISSIQRLVIKGETLSQNIAQA